MIIDDSVNFFGVYHHNCIFNLGLSEKFKDLYEKQKYLNIILCQKDDNGGYLMTQNITERNGKNPNMQSYYFPNRNALKEGYRKLSNKISSSEKIFYLIKISDKNNFNQNEELILRWKNEVKNLIN